MLSTDYHVFSHSHSWFTVVPEYYYSQINWIRYGQLCIICISNSVLKSILFAQHQQNVLEVNRYFNWINVRIIRTTQGRKAGYIDWSQPALESPAKTRD
jgi:hypothetical protein